MPKSAWFFTIFIGLFLSIYIYAPPMGAQDFSRYWSASRLLITGENPYDSHALLILQKENCPKLKFSDKYIAEAWNPPWLLLSITPLAIFPFELSVRLWIFLNIFLLAIALFLSWRMVVGLNLQRFFYLVFYAGFLFGNTWIMIQLGQISSLVLISLILGVLFIRKEKDILAGVVLFLTTIKPHLVYFVLFVILIWSIRNRRWKIWAGMAIAGFSSSFIVWLIYPDWLEVYIQKLFQMPYFNVYCSTLGSFIASFAGINYFRYIGILLLPLAFPLSKLISKDGWLTAINLSLTVSIPISPYGFSFDHVLLLPAVIEMIVWCVKKEIPPPIACITGLGLIITYGALFWMIGQVLEYYWFFWIALALSILYLVAWRYHREPNRKT
jgi:hypothetical protein